MRGDDTIALVLACGHDDGLGGLTVERTKAAVPFGGEYRIVDFVLSNCLHSGLRRMFVLTETKSFSLQAHLRDGWNIFNNVLGQFVMPVGPQMHGGSGCYRGSVDAIAQNRRRFDRADAEQVLVVNGEHVYRMDYAALKAAHSDSGNDVTIACVEMTAPAVSGRTLVKADTDGRVSVITPHAESVQKEDGRVLAAMEVALFKASVLDVALDKAQEGEGLTDLHRDVIPRLLEDFKVGTYLFGGPTGRVSQDRYWTDIATIDDYFSAHMGLLEPVPSIDLYQRNWQIWSYPGKNPPARTAASARGNEGIFVNSIVSNGTVIVGGAVSRSVLCPRVTVEDGATVERSILLSGVTVGAGCELRNCVIDKRVSIPGGTKIGFDREHDRARFSVSESGTVLVPEGHDIWD